MQFMKSHVTPSHPNPYCKLPCTQSNAQGFFSYILISYSYSDVNSSPLSGRVCWESLTFPLHAHDKALLIATVLAAVALALVNEAVFIIPTRVDEVFPYGSLEETFTAFTTVHSIVLSWLQDKSMLSVVLYLSGSLVHKNPWVSLLPPSMGTGMSSGQWDR